MDKPTNALTHLLERIEAELQTPDGRTVLVCRDARGNHWVIDHGERIVPLDEFAARCSLAAREYCAQMRAAELRRLARMAREALARVTQRRPRATLLRV